MPGRGPPKPTGDSTKPTGDSVKPTGDFAKPTEDSTKPAGGIAKPTGGIGKPIGGIGKPIRGIVKPTGGSPKPTIGAEGRKKPSNALPREAHDGQKASNCMASNRIFYPQKTFCIDYEALVRVAVEKEFRFTAVDLAQCQQDIEEQRREQEEHDALEAKFREAHARFLLRQRDRYGRYIQLLDAARGTFRADLAMLAVLKRFNRKPRRRDAADTASPSSEGQQLNSTAPVARA